MSGFKAFILRGNLVELAVAFIMGAAFAAVVTTFTGVIPAFVSRSSAATRTSTASRSGTTRARESRSARSSPR